MDAPVPEVPVPDHGRHVVQFYHDDNFLLEAVSRFVGPALACGDAAVVIATQAHREGLEELLKSHGLDMSKAARQESKQGWRFLRICGRLPRDVGLALFRVLQESLTNVHRHSGSPTVAIRLGQENRATILEIEDQGKGLPPAMLEADSTDLAATPGVGLRGMDERMRQLGGRVELCAGKKGAVVRAVVPVHQGCSRSAEQKEQVSVVERKTGDRNVRCPQPA